MDKNAHIPTQEVINDILITLEEIRRYERKLKSEIEIHNRLGIMSAQSNVNQRRAFVNKLIEILNQREVKHDFKFN